MDTLIYQKGTRIIAGSVSHRKTEAQTRVAIADWVTGICQSELGGTPDDYVAVEVEQAAVPGMIPSINGDGTVAFNPVPIDSWRVRFNEIKAIPKADRTDAEEDELLDLLIARV